MNDESILDKREVKRAFQHAAARYNAHAVLQREVCRRMLERLGYVKRAPRLILDAGSGTGFATRELVQRYPKARIIALDLAHAMLLEARRQEPWWKRVLPFSRSASLCGDIERLPLKPASTGLIFSNLTLQWVSSPERAFAEARRVLEPGGLFMFSTFGPDTLQELRQAFRGADSSSHVTRFIDMHDLGDLLVHSGLADPVMDVEYFTLTYRQVTDLMRDLKAIGAHNALSDRRRGLMGKAALAAVARGYEAFRSDGQLPATFEVVYGHAWKPEQRLGLTGQRVMEIKPLVNT
jgi:malonyl-CoA O-methyltransferase